MPRAGLPDLTDLDEGSDAAAIETPCKRAQALEGSVAAVHVWPRLRGPCQALLAPCSGISIATVVNFTAETTCSTRWLPRPGPRRRRRRPTRSIWSCPEAPGRRRRRGGHRGGADRQGRLRSRDAEGDPRRSARSGTRRDRCRRHARAGGRRRFPLKTPTGRSGRRHRAPPRSCSRGDRPAGHRRLGPAVRTERRGRRSSRARRLILGPGQPARRHFRIGAPACSIGAARGALAATTRTTTPDAGAGGHRPQA